MKTKYIIVFFLLGILTATIGSLFKIMHWKYGVEILLLSVLLKIIALGFAIKKVLSTDKLNDFLNS